MEAGVLREKIYQTLNKLPEHSLAEVWQFIKFLQFKNCQRSPKRVIQLGGLLSEYKCDFAEEDIAKTRMEMWRNLGETHK